jgi:hypothetical protein
MPLEARQTAMPGRRWAATQVLVPAVCRAVPGRAAVKNIADPTAGFRLFERPLVPVLAFVMMPAFWIATAYGDIAVELGRHRGVSVSAGTPGMPGKQGDGGGVDGHQDLPSDGHEVDTMAITEGDRIRSSSRSEICSSLPIQYSWRTWRMSRGARAEDSVMTGERSSLRPGWDRRHLHGPGGGVKMAWVPMRRQMTCGCPDTRSAP